MLLSSPRTGAVRRKEDTMQRMGHVIGLKPEAIAEYKRVHAAVWPEVLAMITACNIRNYSIYLREPENVMFAYWEYHGTDFEADMAKMAADPKTQDWWKICGPMQQPLPTRAQGEWWARMEEVFHID
jgi:L-rhamnose mutarotase